jgi:hypothetical protein
VSNEHFKKLMDHINKHRIEDELIGEGEAFALLFKYWEAECGEQEITEDFSYIMDPEYIFEAKELIRMCDPVKLEGEYEIGYTMYVDTITDEAAEC